VDFIESLADRTLLVDKDTDGQIEKQLVYGCSEAVVHSGVQVMRWNAL
jgi:hypothetical protein